jgi:ATP-binding cassette subfamily E protein 1
MSSPKSSTKKLRIAIVDDTKCQPKKCKQECKRICPVERQGKECIDIENVAKVIESACIGCGMCTTYTKGGCPFNAITIYNINIEPKDAIHRYGENSFALYRLPEPRTGHILGIVGPNGCGKSTAVAVLGFKTMPNFGNFDSKIQLTDKELSVKFRGNFLQKYFINKKKVASKPQHVEMLKRIGELKGLKVMEVLAKYSEVNQELLGQYIDEMSLNKLLDRDIKVLSGGELQRLYCVLTAVRQADVYIYDEPSNFLDIKQRIKLARLLKSKSNDENFVIVIEHDLSLLDYIADNISILYGEPTAYGICARPVGVREGINMLLDGYIPAENMRFREESFNFKNLKNEIDEFELNMLKAKEKKDTGDKKNENDKADSKVYRATAIEEMINSRILIEYPAIEKTLGDFHLKVSASKFILNGGITVILGQNGTGKTVFLNLLAGKLKSDNNAQMPRLSISSKPQHVEELFMEAGSQTVSEFLISHIGNTIVNTEFKVDVLNPLGINKIMDHEVDTLSGGEMQKVAIALTLGKKADLYLIDEPSANLDYEMRLKVSKAIKNYITHIQKTVFVVEHDILMSIYLAHSLFGRVIVFDGEPGVSTIASESMTLKAGMNIFLKQLGITIRTDRNNGRPRINKFNGRSDKEQKKSGNYFALDDI